MMDKKKKTSIVISPDAELVWVELARRFSFTKTAVMELAIRELARREFGNDYMDRIRQQSPR